LIAELKKIELLKREYITIEYMMLNEINDSIDYARQLVKLLNGLKVKINLIPYNPTKNLPVRPSSEKTINEFIKYLLDKSLVVTVRRSAGTEIDGGCGQFALKKVVIKNDE
jgi:23S rRNA (adenine2503-C2)-methyltransferase